MIDEDNRGDLVIFYWGLFEVGIHSIMAVRKNLIY